MNIRTLFAYLRNEEPAAESLPCRILDTKDALTWQDIESAPKDGSEIILFGREYGQFMGWWQNHTHGAGWAQEGDATHYFHSEEPTHWMPLPDNPK